MTTMATITTSIRRTHASPATFDEVDARLRDELLGRDLIAFGPVHAIALAVSKRVRAALVLACARAVRTPPQLAVDLAVAVELVHTFSLVHDDIEDGAEMRRGHPAVHVVEGVPIAINAGDAVHALAWSALLAVDAPPARKLDVACLFASTLERMVAGQARDLVWTRDRRGDLSIGDYIAMIRGKTGALMGFASAAPAQIVGHAATGKLYQFGEQLGIALQILDDVASVRGDRDALGKPVGPSTYSAGSAPALLDGPTHDGTSAAIRLARHHWACAVEILTGAGIEHDELAALTRSMLAQLLTCCGASTEFETEVG